MRFSVKIPKTKFPNRFITTISAALRRRQTQAESEVFRKDPAYAIERLNSILEDGEQAQLLIALRQMTKAFGRVRSATTEAELNPNQLYRNRGKGV
ncbi:DNA-binding protein [Photorhabdus luminescens]|uniref:helix-turn-helix domain-containing transcriptional regulator n=1 Tax=Photorhabdus luminescens TaxID=29488 RepID=UPI00223EDC6A|nr:hypothetical protein [Photorhabdus luminescens]MCW7762499.1 hypothetical protein [Photorhabdus luminescens subsp. venezuelensis]